MTPRKIALYVVASPLLVFLVIYQVILVPFILAMLPLWALLELIEVLKGEKSSLMSMLASVATIPLQMAYDILGEKKPRWLERL